MTKYIIIALLVALSAGVGYAQTNPNIQNLKLSDSTAVLAYYAASQKDTTQAYQLSRWDRAYLVFDMDDSVSAVVKYWPSYDGATFDDAGVTIDSVSTQGDGASAANGIQYSVAIPQTAMGLPAVKFTIEFNSYGNGFTTPTYSCKIVRR